MKIFLASDHAGFKAKESINNFLKQKGVEVTDLGPFEYDKKDDYPDYIYPCAEKVKQEESFGIVFGKSGQGEAIVANRVKGIRAIVLNKEDQEVIKLGRLHNNANMLSIGTDFVSEDFMKEAVEVFIATEFSNEERHIRRINKIDNV